MQISNRYYKGDLKHTYKIEKRVYCDSPHRHINVKRCDN